MQSATFVALLILLKTVHLSLNGTSNIVNNMKYLLDFVCLIWFFTSTQQSFSYAGRSSWVEPVLS